MSSKNVRRASVITGLALLPAIAFGGIAEASTATAAHAPASAQQQGGDHAGQVKVKGQITDVQHKKVHDKDATKITVSGKDGQKGGGQKSKDFIVTPRTVVTKDGKPVPAKALHKGQNVTAAGKQAPKGDAAVAQHVNIDH